MFHVNTTAKYNRVVLFREILLGMFSEARIGELRFTLALKKTVTATLEIVTIQCEKAMGLGLIPK